MTVELKNIASKISEILNEYHPDKLRVETDNRMIRVRWNYWEQFSFEIEDRILNEAIPKGFCTYWDAEDHDDRLPTYVFIVETEL